jgi:hypothetical protein
MQSPVQSPQGPKELSNLVPLRLRLQFGTLVVATIRIMTPGDSPRIFGGEDDRSLATIVVSPNHVRSDLPGLMVSGFPFAARCSFSQHRLPSQTPLPRLNWALPLLDSVVMVYMTDPIVGKTARQLDGYGLHDYVGRATPATILQTILCCK